MNNENSDIFILNRDKTPVKYLIKQDPKFEKIVNLVGEITLGFIIVETVNL